MTAVGWCDVCGGDGDLIPLDDRYREFVCRSCAVVAALSDEQVRAVADRIVTGRMERREGWA